MNNQLSADSVEWWMARLLRQAHRTGNDGDVPVTAVILNQLGHCIGWGRNCRERTKDPMGHAELVALRQASHLQSSWRFNQCTMIVTLEPCTMCSGALLQARMSTVIYGTSDYKRGGLGGTLDLSKQDNAHHKMSIIRGIKSKQSCELLETWFRKRRSL
uniref:Cytidine/deoxycytidylate deaminase family protein n=1 Tax=Paulinella micropora TaxID=1928728 RepID=A0A385HZV7_9EUKA|nr:cytidine/deoxycytidylate deaminase family protein [Paulinella micropora]AXY63197.1 cytidine/deoxycytidylate deaminase family protein [Paulinella micropora]